MNKNLRIVVPRQGERVLYNSRVVTIQGIPDWNSAVVKDIEGKLEVVKIEDLQACPTEGQESNHKTLLILSPAAREVAEFRESVIKELVNKAGRTRADVKARAKEFGLSVSTLYEWLSDYDGSLISLCKKERSDKGSQRLEPLVEAVVKNTLDNLKPEDKSKKKIWNTIKERIENLKNLSLVDLKQEPQFSEIKLPANPSLITPPHENTVANRLRSIAPRKTLARLCGEKAAQEKFDPILGSLRADFPLEILQIDHSLLDIIPLDNVTRKPIKRLWITLAFDVFSRMVWGYHISEDPPGAMSTGLCLAHAILPKEDYLKRLGSTGEYPCWGKPAAVHGDNAFRLDLLRQNCQDYGFDLIWRRVKNPRIGGHIERYLGTLGQAIHFLPGTTFSSPDERGEYDSEGKATMVVAQIEQWVTERILAYHAERHSALGMPPIERLRQGIFKGTELHPAVGLQPRIVDPKEQTRLKLDFTPFTLRTIQRYGVQIERITYYHDAMRRWINAPDPDHPNLKRKFRFPRFYERVNSAFFLDPALNEYFEIPTRDPSFPAMSIWDLRRIRALAKKEGVKNSDVNEQYIKARYLRMREIEDQAAADTRAARSLKQRRANWAAAAKPELPTEAATSEARPEDERYDEVDEYIEDD